MKIALISAFVFDDSIGGLENHILFMGRAFVNMGHDIKIFKPVWDAEFEFSEKQIEGLTIHYVNLGKRPYNTLTRSGRGWGLLAGLLGKLSYSLRAEALVNAVTNWQPEIVWQHDFSSSWRASRRLATTFPVVLTNHTGEYLFLRKLPFNKLLLRAILGHYSAVIGPSQELTPQFLANSHTIHNGVDLSQFKPLSEQERQTLRNELYDKLDSFVVFCPRRWAPTKGIYYLAQALTYLEAEADEFHFVFAGSDYWGFPAYIEEVDALLASTDVPFVKLGNLSVQEMLLYYQTADLVVIPSLMEAVSLSALEAMACGTAVLSTDVGGMPELIREGQTGFLVPPADAKALASKLQAVRLKDLLAVRTKALELVTSIYAWERIAEKTEAVIRPLAGRASPPEPS